MLEWKYETHGMGFVAVAKSPSFTLLYKTTSFHLFKIIFLKKVL